MKIDEQTMVPLGAVLSGLIFILSVTISSAVVGTFWVGSVNTRLARIEEKLGIPPTASQRTAFINEARAE